MTEQKIEKIIIDSISAALSAAQIDGLQIIGAWQVADDGDIKALEDGSKRGVITVKVMPCTYDTPTIPDGQMAAQISLAMRADMDGDGKGYLDVTEVLSGLIHSWQKSFDTYAAAFEISGEFTPTGFQITDGGCGIDRESCVWEYSQTLDIIGIIA